MEGMFGLLLVVGVGSVAYLLFWLTSQTRAQAWRAAAQAAGLTNIKAPTILGLELKLTGEARGLDVAVESFSRGKHKHGTRVSIGGLRHGTDRLSMRAEGVTSAIEKTFGEHEIEVGDPAFDAVAFLQGEPALIRAIFDADTRRLVRALLSGGLTADGPSGRKTFSNLRVSVSANELRVEIPSSLFNRTEEWLPALLPQLLAMGERLRRPDDVAGRLAANARGDVLEAVRLACLKTLVSEFRDGAVTRDALVAALGDDSVDVRLFAAVALGPDGQATLLALATDRQPDAIAARAIAALGPAFTVAQAIERLARARADGHPVTAIACIDALGRSGDEAAIAPLIAALPGDADVSIAAARALGARGNAVAEPSLMAALSHEAAPVRVAAAEALGRLGTPQAVPSLRDASEAHRLDGELRRAARQAIAEIQGRITGASPGQLSLADAQSGQVTLVDEDTQGRLSLETAEPVPAARRAAQAANRSAQGTGR